MNEQRFTMLNLTSREMLGHIDELIDIISTVELNNYEEGRFQNGPTMIEFKPTELGSNDQTFRVYIPVNAEVVTEGADGVNWDWIPELDIPKVIRTRTFFDEGIETKLSEMKDYLKDNQKAYDDRLILLVSKIYDEYWVDMVIPYE